MNTIKSCFKGLSILTLCMVMTIFSTFANAAEPWWTNPQLEWKPFTALPTVDVPCGYHWEIDERSEGENPKFFAQAIANNSGYPGRFLLANASLLPVFTEPVTDLSFGSAYAGITAYPTSSGMVRWNKSYDEFFIGSASGIWRFDEDLNHYVKVWDWYWDPVYIVSLGNSIYGAVLNSGSGSGYHMWTPQGGDNFFAPGSASYQIWGDPISKNYGTRSLTRVRTISPTKSIYCSNWGSQYSFDGGQTLFTPIGTKNGGGSLYVTDFYPYTETEVIVKDSYYYLYIGTLGGSFYQLNFPTNTTSSQLDTLFYSPSTRLLIAGNSKTYGLFYTVLPGPDEVDGPKLDIQSAFILSWSTNYPSTVLESTTDLVTGTWSAVDAPYNIVSNKVQVAVPANKPKEFYRLVYP